MTRNTKNGYFLKRFLCAVRKEYCVRRRAASLILTWSIVIIAAAGCAVVPSSLRFVLNRWSVKAQGKPETVAHVENITIPGPGGEIPLRIYTPEGSGPFPMLIYFHGGGWVLGNLDTRNNTCHFLSTAAGCIVISADYRLAPKHKFPSAVEDAYAATLWAAGHAGGINGDASRIAVAGDSAGGNLAAVVCLMAQDRGTPPLVLQVLAYPATNLATLETDSYRNFAKGYGLTKSHIRWFRKQYLADEKDRKNPYASPLLADNLSKVPPALVLTAEFDVLRDEGESYVKRLREAGVSARFIRYADRGHMACWTTSSGRAGDAQYQMVFALRAAFQGNTARFFRE